MGNINNNSKTCNGNILGLFGNNSPQIDKAANQFVTTLVHGKHFLSDKFSGGVSSYCSVQMNPVDCVLFISFGFSLGIMCPFSFSHDICICLSIVNTVVCLCTAVFVCFLDVEIAKNLDTSADEIGLHSVHIDY